MSGQALPTPSRSPATQPNGKKTKKDQKAFQIGPVYDAQKINSEFDRLHERINGVQVESAALADLPTNGTVTNDQLSARINALAAIMVQAGLLKSS